MSEGSEPLLVANDDEGWDAIEARGALPKPLSVAQVLHSSAPIAQLREHGVVKLGEFTIQVKGSA